MTTYIKLKSLFKPDCSFTSPAPTDNNSAMAHMPVTTSSIQHKNGNESR